MFGIDIFGVTIVESSFGIVHDTVGIAPIFVEFSQIERIVGDIVELCHDGHYHV